jgi:uncharacterized membrane protein (UPF0127 family)
MSRRKLFGMTTVIGTLVALLSALQLMVGTMVATPVTGIATSSQPMAVSTTTPRSYYEPLYPMQLGDTEVFASLARTDAEHEHGLSDTTVLPPDIVKLFVFATDSRWGFWMKDMHYPIDMVWLDARGQVVYVVPDATPASYPGTSFVPPVPARYVIETVAGFAESHKIATGTPVMLPVTIP